MPNFSMRSLSNLRAAQSKQLGCVGFVASGLLQACST